ncbi:BspA family leucine-rich repeat surface protein, partial [Enterococcus faecium]|nr:BspA family leucine-rich repeat surface protein [Enterococcus faecium]
SNFDTSQVTNMYAVFGYCSSLQSLDLSSFDTSQVTNMLDMFRDCSGLNELILGEKSIFNDTVHLPDSGWMGKNTHVIYGASTDFMNNYDGSHPDTFVRTTEIKYWGTSPYTFDESTGTMIVSAGTLGEYGEQPWGKGEVSAEKIQKIELVGNVVAPVESSWLFSAAEPTNTLINLNEITGMENLDTSHVIKMRSMFVDCRSLKNLDVSHFNTSNVTDMSSMFYDCRSLTTLDVSSFDTSQVTDMGAMFYQCNSLQNLDLSNFNTKQVTSMYSMFYGCSNLQNINMSSFDTSQVTTMYNMFTKCTSLKILDLSSFDTSQVMDMEFMFKDCTNLNELTLGKKSIFNDTVDLRDGTWLGKNTGVRYATSADFMNNYDGSQPDTFVRTETKYWGTSPYMFDETTGTLTVYAGELDSSAGSPWNKGDVAAGNIKKIVIEGHVIAPENSAYLFSDDTKKQFLTNLVEITGLSN